MGAFRVPGYSQGGEKCFWMLSALELFQNDVSGILLDVLESKGFSIFQSKPGFLVNNQVF